MAATYRAPETSRCALDGDNSHFNVRLADNKIGFPRLPGRLPILVDGQEWRRWWSCIVPISARSREQDPPCTFNSRATVRDGLQPQHCKRVCGKHRRYCWRIQATRDAAYGIHRLGVWARQLARNCIPGDCSHKSAVGTTFSYGGTALDRYSTNTSTMNPTRFYRNLYLVPVSFFAPGHSATNSPPQRSSTSSISRNIPRSGFADSMESLVGSLDDRLLASRAKKLCYPVIFLCHPTMTAFGCC